VNDIFHCFYLKQDETLKKPTVNPGAIHIGGKGVSDGVGVGEHIKRGQTKEFASIVVRRPQNPYYLGNLKESFLIPGRFVFFGAIIISCVSFSCMFLIPL